MQVKYFFKRYEPKDINNNKTISVIIVMRIKKGKSIFGWIIFLAIAMIVFYFIIEYLLQKIFPDTNDFSNYKCRGFAEDTAEYIMPTEHPNFITDEEREYIMKEASTRFADSVTVGGRDTSVRKSETAWLDKNEGPVKNIIQRVCDMTGHPFEHAESLQVVKYGKDGFYNPHHDACCDQAESCMEFENKDGGQRIVTMLIYLTDDFEGGSTKFPNLDKEFKPPKNGAVLFYPMEKSGKRCHPYALHGGMPVTKGEKYVCNVWIRERPFR
jgi:prolyl 4-hydroxylase